MDHKNCALHDVRNTLCIIEGHLSRAKRICAGADVLSPDEILPSLASIAAAVKSLKALAKRLAPNGQTETFDGLGAIPFASLADFLRDEATPALASLYGVEVSLEANPFVSLQRRGSIVADINHVFCFTDNLVANAVSAGASRVAITLIEHQRTVDLVFRDNGRGMTEEQARQLGFGFTTKGESGHGQGFRIIRKLVADIGGTVTTPKSIVGFGTEITITLMKSGSALQQNADIHAVQEGTGVELTRSGKRC